MYIIILTGGMEFEMSFSQMLCNAIETFDILMMNDIGLPIHDIGAIRSMLHYGASKGFKALKYLIRSTGKCSFKRKILY